MKTIVKKKVIEKVSEDKKELLKLTIEAHKLNVAKLSIGDKTIMVDNNSLISIQNYIDNIIKFNVYWASLIEKYKNYSEIRINEILKCQTNHSGLYYIGENFAEFMDIVVDNQPDNYLATMSIKKDLAKDWEPAKIRKLIFRPETNYCYIYTKNKLIAAEFLWWSYKKYIEPKLKKLL